MLIKEIIPYIPWLVIAFLGLLSFLSFVIHKRAIGNPSKTWEDDWDANLQRINEMAFQGAEWLGEAMKKKGDEKLAIMLKQIQIVEALWKQGKKSEAIANLLAFLWDAKGKFEKSRSLCSSRMASE